MIAVLGVGVLLIVVAAVILGVVASSHGSSSDAGNKFDFPPQGAAPAPAETGHVRDTERAGVFGPGERAATVKVQLNQVIDPASPDSRYDTPSAGHRLVGVKFTITAVTPATDSADLNTTVTGSDNETYHSSISSIAGCTDFDNGEFRLPARGSESVGCVAIELPDGVTVKSVQFGDPLGTVASWQVP